MLWAKQSFALKSAAIASMGEPPQRFALGTRPTQYAERYAKALASRRPLGLSQSSEYALRARFANGKFCISHI